MKLLLLTFYFPPDLSAGSFRMDALVKALHAQDPDLEIELITTLPNRYASLKSEAPELEERPGLTIRRIPLPAHQSGMIDQSRAFTVFGRKVLKATRGRSWDIVFTTSSRLMTAVLGARVARRAKAPLYLDIRDLFTDTMTDLLAGKSARHVLPVFRRLERYAFRRADRMNVVSEGFLDHIHRVVPKHDCRVFTNGIDPAFLDKDYTKPSGQDGLPVVLYAGNMGQGQGLDTVVPEAARLLQGTARIRLLGDGGQRAELERAAAGADNIEILNPVPRAELDAHYREADILFLHLNHHAAFLKVLPSKIFEYAATGKPVLAGVAGHAGEFLKREVEGAEVFAPGDAQAMVEGVRRLLDGPAHRPRIAFREKFARSAIMAAMAKDILDLG